MLRHELTYRDKNSVPMKLNKLPHDILYLILETSASYAERETPCNNPLQVLISLASSCRDFRYVYNSEKTNLIRAALRTVTGGCYQLALDLASAELPKEEADTETLLQHAIRNDIAITKWAFHFHHEHLVTACPAAALEQARLKPLSASKLAVYTYALGGFPAGTLEFPSWQHPNFFPAISWVDTDPLVLLGFLKWKLSHYFARLRKDMLTSYDDEPEELALWIRRVDRMKNWAVKDGKIKGRWKFVADMAGVLMDQAQEDALDWQKALAKGDFHEFRGVRIVDDWQLYGKFDRMKLLDQWLEMHAD